MAPKQTARKQAVPMTLRQLSILFERAYSPQKKRGVLTKIIQAQIFYCIFGAGTLLSACSEQPPGALDRGQGMQRANAAYMLSLLIPR